MHFLTADIRPLRDMVINRSLMAAMLRRLHGKMAGTSGKDDYVESIALHLEKCGGYLSIGIKASKEEHQAAREMTDFHFLRAGVVVFGDRKIVRGCGPSAVLNKVLHDLWEYMQMYGVEGGCWTMERYERDVYKPLAVHAEESEERWIRYARRLYEEPRIDWPFNVACGYAPHVEYMKKEVSVYKTPNLGNIPLPWLKDVEHKVKHA